LKGAVKEPSMFHNYETEKITRKATDAAAIIWSCSVLPPEIVMHDASFNVILWTSADICVVHDDLGRNNQTTRNRFWRAGCSQL